jgi:DNA-binding NarL/FixJ family response regulator
MNQPLTDDPAIRVGVVDDHIIFALPFADMLNKFGGIRTTLTATSGEELLRLLKTIDAAEMPHIILMDVSMPNMNGIEATRHVSRLYPAIKVVALSAGSDEFTIIKMIRAGACDYLKKDIDPKALKNALIEVYEKEKYHTNLYHLDKDGKPRNRKKDVPFTEREIEIIQYMREGYKNEQIAKAMHLSVSTVKQCKSMICEKMDTDNAIGVVIEANRRGIISIEEDRKYNH